MFLLVVQTLVTVRKLVIIYCNVYFVQASRAVVSEYVVLALDFDIILTFYSFPQGERLPVLLLIRKRGFSPDARAS